MNYYNSSLSVFLTDTENTSDKADPGFANKDLTMVTKDTNQDVQETENVRSKPVPVKQGSRVSMLSSNVRKAGKFMVLCLQLYYISFL